MIDIRYVSRIFVKKFIFKKKMYNGHLCLESLLQVYHSIQVCNVLERCLKKIVKALERSHGSYFSHPFHIIHKESKYVLLDDVLKMDLLFSLTLGFRFSIG